MDKAAKVIGKSVKKWYFSQKAATHNAAAVKIAKLLRVNLLRKRLHRRRNRAKVRFV